MDCRPHNPSKDVEAANLPKRRWGSRTARAEPDGRGFKNSRRDGVRKELERAKGFELTFVPG